MSKINTPVVSLNISDKTEHDIYSDTIQPAARELGQLLAKPIRGLNYLADWFGQWVSSKRQQQNTKQLADDVENILKDVPKENLHEPPPNILPAAIVANSVNEADVLRKMYANLIAKACDSRYQDMVHPSYVKTIEQLSPAEAVFIRDQPILKGALPICKIRVQERGATSPFPESDKLHPLNILRYSSAGHDLFKHYICYETGNTPEQLALMIDNLVRLGLLRCSYDSCLTSAIVYRRYYMDAFTAKYSSAETDTQELVHIPGLIEPTVFGKSFYSSCVEASGMAQ